MSESERLIELTRGCIVVVVPCVVREQVHEITPADETVVVLDGKQLFITGQVTPPVLIGEES